MQRLYFFIFYLLFGFILAAQSTYAPLDPNYYHLIDRYEIKNKEFATSLFTANKPYLRKDIVAFIDTVKKNVSSVSTTDQFNFKYLTLDSWEWMDSAEYNYKSKEPILKYFYRSKTDLFHVKTKDFQVHINPVLYLAVGADEDASGTPFINTRGVEIRGMVDKKVGFYSFLGENQIIFPGYVQNYVDSLGVVPHEGFWKTFKENGVDFFTPRGYITFKATEHIQFQFGHGKNFIGNGYRSLILSDFSANYLYLKINTKVWRFNYMNLFTNMIADVFRTPNSGLASGDFPEKFMSLHHLSLNITDNLNIGFFEAIVFGRQDSLGNNQFELDYLNPVIFFRAIEQQGGSPDNALLGVDAKWNFLNKFSVYGQFFLDEFLLENIREGNGWWGNKFGGQLGGKYIDVFGVKNLDAQLEYNFARPYAYSHTSNFTNYSNYRQALAHPLGANFKEIVAIGRYQPLPRLSLTGKLIMADYGADDENSNYGQNILLDFATREMDFNNETGQGIDTNLTLLDLTASYHLKYNLFIDIKQVFRELDSGIEARDISSSFTSFAVRWNIRQRVHEF